MLLTISTTHQPATDLGFLLMKHPDNVHSTDLPFGRAVLFFPQADETQCTAALTLEIDPVELVRGKGWHAGAAGPVRQRSSLCCLIADVGCDRAHAEHRDGGAVQTSPGPR